MKLLTCTLPLLTLTAIVVFANKSSASKWRTATEKELQDIIPARAPVIKERIETEFRTASGITDGNGRFIAGVVLITAGYSADGKYSHFLVAQAPLKIGDLLLKPGKYVFGYQRGEDALSVKFYEAESGKPLGTVPAKRINRIGRLEAFHISTPAEKPVIQIGRFGMEYTLEER